MADVEKAVELNSCVLHLREVFVFKPPTRSSAQGWAAQSFGIDKPMFTGELKVMVQGESCQIRLYQKPKAKAAKGKEGELVFFAGCPIVIDYGDAGAAAGGSGAAAAAAAASGAPSRRLAPLQQLDQVVESVVDSSRYFVLRVEDEASGRRAFLAFGVAERADAFSFKSALQDHVRFVGRQRGADVRRAAEEALEAAAAAGDADAEAQLAKARGKMRDLTLKEGQTIKIDTSKLGGGGKKKRAPPRPSGAAGGGGGGGGLLKPPPPGGGLLKPPPPPPSAAAAAPPAPAGAGAGDTAAAASAGAGADVAAAPAGAPAAEEEDDDWGDFQ
jgi:hypothetical protein